MAKYKRCLLYTSAREALTGMECPVAADIGCDHGFLTAKLLETVPNLTMLASDVSAPSLEKARRLLAARGLSGRATLAVADGLSAIDRLVDAVMILGMGAGTILKIVSEMCIRDRCMTRSWLSAFTSSLTSGQDSSTMTPMRPPIWL